MKSKTTFCAVVGLALVSTSRSAEVINYWDFDTIENDLPADVVGGVGMAAVGTPDFTTHATYGSAYAGAGRSLNTATPTGTGNYLIADVYDGTAPTAMDFGTGNFSYSYWSWDASDEDNDPRGPRVFDNLNGATTGLHASTNGTGLYNLRLDDDAGNFVRSDDTLSANQADGEWVHVAVNVDRTGAKVGEIFFDNVSQGTFDISSLTGAIFATADLQIGVINTGVNIGGAQQSGLDDLAFYSGLLSSADIAGLAAATLTPDLIVGVSAKPFEITAISRDGDDVTVTWNSIPGASYAVDFSSDLLDWDDELTDSAKADGESASYTHTTSEVRGYYRIRVPD